MSEIVRSASAEEEELASRQAQLTRLEARLAQRELDLATLLAELHAFEARYVRAVGVLYWELDEINARIAEANACLHPDKVEVQRKAARARAKERETAEAVGRAPEPKQEDGFKPSEDLKRLYRKLAKRVHPDLAADEDERERRHAFMAEANTAYENGDTERLKALLDEWELSPEAVKGEDLASRLDRVNRKIERARRRLEAIRARIEELNLSQMSSLKRKVEKAADLGRDLLSDMAVRVREDIAEAGKRLDQLRKRVQADERQQT